MQCAHQSKTSSRTRTAEVQVLKTSATFAEAKSRGMEEFAQVAERILQSLNAVFEKDDSL